MSVGFPSKRDSLESLDRATLDSYKKSYAFALLKDPTDTLKAALTIFPIDKTAALKISNVWPNDPDVVMFMREIVEQQGEEDFLPSKTKFLNKIWDKLDAAYIDNSDFTKLSDIYAKLRGFYPETKKENPLMLNVGGMAKVMVVMSSPTDDEWEKKSQRLHQNLLQDEY